MIVIAASWSSFPLLYRGVHHNVARQTLMRTFSACTSAYHGQSALSSAGPGRCRFRLLQVNCKLSLHVKPEGQAYAYNAHMNLHARAPIMLHHALTMVVAIMMPIWSVILRSTCMLVKRVKASCCMRLDTSCISMRSWRQCSSAWAVGAIYMF